MGAEVRSRRPVRRRDARSPREKGDWTAEDDGDVVCCCDRLIKEEVIVRYSTVASSRGVCARISARRCPVGMNDYRVQAVGMRRSQ